MKFETLGTEKESSRYKIYYFLFIIFVFLFCFWAWIGNEAARSSIQFYLMFGIFALFFILFDNATSKTFEFIDTVTIEEPRIEFLSPKTVLILSIAFSLILSYNIITQKQAWIDYPKFQIFDSKTINAFLSGILGVIENWVFFGFLFPTIFAVLKYRRFGEIPSLILSLMISSLSFSIFHIFVYGSNITAMFSTVSFAIVCCLMTYILRNLIFADVLHFSNNFVAYMVNAGVGFMIKI